MSKEYRDRVWQQSKLKGGKLLVMLALAEHADAKGECWPGMPILMEKSRLTDRQIRRVLNALATEGYLAIEERAIGRGKRPHYRLFPDEKADILSVNKEQKADIFDGKSGHFVHGKADIFDGKADISDANYSHARSEPLEPTTEPKREERAAPAAPPVPDDLLVALPSRVSQNGAMVHKSRHINKRHFDPQTGYVPVGTGATAVEVYYERFDIQRREEKLTFPQEDDLVRRCPDLDRLRQVIEAYDRAGFKNRRNLELIFDWYRDGVPNKHQRKDQPHANRWRSNPDPAPADESAVSAEDDAYYREFFRRQAAERAAAASH
jgi:hypothetical protein